MERLPIVVEASEIRRLYDETNPIPGRPGWRIDKQGKEWYSAHWLNPNYDDATKGK